MSQNFVVCKALALHGSDAALQHFAKELCTRAPVKSVAFTVQNTLLILSLIGEF